MIKSSSDPINSRKAPRPMLRKPSYPWCRGFAGLTNVPARQERTALANGPLATANPRRQGDAVISTSEYRGVP